MAKSLGIRPPAGQNNPDSVDAKVLSPVTPTGSLGSIASDILAAQVDPSRVLVDLTNRKVYASTVEENTVPDQYGFTGSAGGGYQEELGFFALDDATKRSSTWSRVGSAGYTVTPPAGETLAEQVISKPGKRVYSLASLISALEDEMAEGGILAGNPNLLALADQATGEVLVLSYDTAAHLNAQVALRAGNATIKFEQIPAAEAAGEAAQAFE